MRAKAIWIIVLLVLLGVLTYMIVQSQRDLTEEEAIALVAAQEPELAQYGELSLPPSEVQSRKTEEGWRLAFVQSGSGLPGVLHAKCFLVSEKKEIKETGEYVRAENEVATSVHIEDCSPVLLHDDSVVAPEPAAVSTPPTEPVAGGKCYVGGCSSQLCTDQPDVASTCEYRSEYACYRTAKCERQSNGQCGWTKTPALTSCLANPPEAT